MKSEKGFSAVEVVGILVVVALVGVAGYLVFNRQKDTVDAPAVSTVEPTTEDMEVGECTVPAGYVVYSFESAADVGFCFAYPAAWGSVTLKEGVIDADNEIGTAYLGLFSANENASFAFKSSAWLYTGLGRGEPNHATGFTEYEAFTASEGDTTQYSLKINSEEKLLIAATTMFNMDGVIVWAHKRFVDSEPYAGIEFQLNVPVDGEFNFETADPDSIVSALQYEQMTTILESVREF